MRKVAISKRGQGKNYKNRIQKDRDQERHGDMSRDRARL